LEDNFRKNWVCHPESVLGYGVAAEKRGGVGGSAARKGVRGPPKRKNRAKPESEPSDAAYQGKRV